MSFPIIEEIANKPFLCKGTWIKLEHYVIPSIPLKKHENYGYCSICWECGFKDNLSSPNPENIRRNSPYADSGINNKYFNSCGADTL